MVLSPDVLLFASHKGGTGKTLLCFQSACQYAVEHPSEKVLLFDLTELGDLTKRCLGHNREIMKKETGAIFDIVDELAHRESDQKNDTQYSLFSMFRKPAEDNKDFIDFTKSVHPGSAEYNEITGRKMPDNLFLVSSGAATTNIEEKNLNYVHLANTLRAHLDGDKNQWKVFIDTDGDRRPAPFTILGYMLADLIIVPLLVDTADFNRVEQMIDTVGKLKEEMKFNAKICQIVFNNMQVTKGEKDANGNPFTTTKVADEVILDLTKKLYNRKSDLFLHKDAPSLEEFSRLSVCRIRAFANNLCLTSNGMGIPFCIMQKGGTQVGSATVTTTQDQIDAAEDNIGDLIDRFTKMQVSEAG